MALKKKLEEGLRSALKARQGFQVNAFREMIGAFRYAEIDKNRELTESDEIEVLSKLKKRHLESIEAFEKGNRADLVNQEREELKVVEQFLPGPLAPEEIKQMVTQAISDLGARSIKDLGKVMAALKAQYLGRADGKVVSEEVKGQLSELGGS